VFFCCGGARIATGFQPARPNILRRFLLVDKKSSGSWPSDKHTRNQQEKYLGRRNWLRAHYRSDRRRWNDQMVWHLRLPSRSCSWSLATRSPGQTVNKTKDIPLATWELNSVCITYARVLFGAERIENLCHKTRTAHFPPSFLSRKKKKKKKLNAPLFYVASGKRLSAKFFFFLLLLERRGKKVYDGEGRNESVYSWGHSLEWM